MSQDITSEEIIEDIHLEDTEEMTEAAAHKKKAEKKADALKQCQQEKQEYLDGWQRARADFANAQKEHVKQLATAKDFTVDRVVTDLLPVLDSFAMAMMNKEVWESVDSTWRQGVEFIHQQLQSVLDTYQVVTFGKIGDSFDPSIHQPIQEIPGPSDQVDMVQSVLRAGYKRNDIVLRPAQIAVGVAEDTSSESEEANTEEG